MRLLVIADIHGRVNTLPGILEKVKRFNPDAVVVCGDITNFGKPPGWTKTLLESIPTKILAVPGNCDSREILKEIEATGAVNLHKKKVELQGHIFVGFGGSNPTSFGPMFTTSENEIFSSLDRLMEGGVILVAHVPPKGFLDRVFVGIHAGSTAIAQIVERYEPMIVLSAHIHEARGVERKGKSVFVNPGPAFDGYAAVVEIDGEVRVELVE